MTGRAVKLMRHNLVVAALVVATIPIGSASQAAVLVNGDARSHDIVITEGDRERAVALKAGGQLDGICDKGCVLRINGEPAEGWELKGPERVTIEDGLLFYDGPQETKSADDAAGDAGSSP